MTDATLTSNELTEALSYEGQKDAWLDDLLTYLHFDPVTKSHPDWVARAQAAEAELANLKAPAPETLAAPRVYTHVKTGNQYEVLHDATETTNGSREGRGVVVYRRIGQTAVYVREATEFHEKFVSSGKPDAQKAGEQQS